MPCEDLPSGDGYSVDSGVNPRPNPDRSVSAPSGPTTVASAPEPPSAEEAEALLLEIPVVPAGSMAGYSREEFPHRADDGTSFGWPSTDGSCGVRDDTLIRDGEEVSVSGRCSVSGTWVDLYTGLVLTSSSNVDIDHVVVPLANAWRSAASGWSGAEREAYANDPAVLLAADAVANRQKGDKGPEARGPTRPRSGRGRSLSGWRRARS